MTSDEQLIFLTKDVLSRLKLTESVYKKYIKILEDAGMTFQRNQRGHRFFSLTDMTLLERFIELNNDGVTLHESANIVVSDFKSGNQEGHNVRKAKLPITRSELEKRDEHILSQIKEVLSEQQKQIDRNHQIVMKRLEERDQLLLENVRQLQEVKKTTAAGKEKKWYQFWK